MLFVEVGSFGLRPNDVARLSRWHASPRRGNICQTLAIMVPSWYWGRCQRTEPNLSDEEMTATRGISAFFRAYAVAPVLDRPVVASAEDERATGIEHDHEFPIRSMDSHQSRFSFVPPVSWLWNGRHRVEIPGSTGVYRCGMVHDRDASAAIDIRRRRSQDLGLR
jgi:hypothetical protein